MRPIDADSVLRELKLQYPSMPLFKELREKWAIRTEGYIEAGKIIMNAPVIKTKVIKYYDEEEQAWTIGSVIIDEAHGAPTIDRPQEWVLCKERLPREYEVLCCDIYNSCIVGRPFADDSASTGFCAENEGEFMYECVAWMPLPKPWKGADDETTT